AHGVRIARCIGNLLERKKAPPSGERVGGRAEFSGLFAERRLAFYFPCGWLTGCHLDHTAATTASATSTVVPLPPTSGVRGLPAFNTVATAFRTAAALFASPRCSSNMPADKIAASGLAMPLPAMSGAEPCTGSNMLGYVRSGLMLPLAARPMLPGTIALRSVRMSPNRLLATTTSDDSSFPP